MNTSTRRGFLKAALSVAAVAAVPAVVTPAARRYVTRTGSQLSKSTSLSGYREFYRYQEVYAENSQIGFQSRMAEGWNSSAGRAHVKRQRAKAAVYEMLYGGRSWA